MLSYVQLHTGFAAASLMICVTCLLFTLIQRRTVKPQNRLFIAVNLLLGSNAVCELAVSFASVQFQKSGSCFTMLCIAQFLYFLTHVALAPVFFYYILVVCGSYSRQRIRKRVLYAAVFIGMEVLVLLNPLLHWVYEVGADGTFHRRWAETVLYLCGAFYTVMAICRVYFSWNALTPRRRLAMVYFFCVMLVGIVTQIVSPQIRVEVFSETVGLIGVLLCMENEDDRIDIDNGFYNRKALRIDLSGYLVNRRPVWLIAVRITNGDILTRISGNENTDQISEVISGYLASIVPVYYPYMTNPGTFVLAVPDITRESAEATAADIWQRFQAPWQYGDGETEVMLRAAVMVADMPGRLKTPAEACLMVDSPLPAGSEKSLLKGSDLDYLLRRTAVENAVSRGLEAGSFEVFYQPTYSPDGRLHGAEALIRMHDSELGDLYPDEFIPVAEQMGLIDDIDEFVLHEVCRFIQSGAPKQYGMDCINVNLSVMQCMKPGFVEHINEIVEKYGVKKDFLNFEITESVAADDYTLLSRVVSVLKREGFLFSMDDYGTGYSNMHAILSLNLDVIKIDKSILWGAEESELGYIILENTIRMIRQMHRKILVEGVETASQISLLAKLGVDYLQGFFFSKPVPLEQFKAIVSKNA